MLEHLNASAADYLQRIVPDAVRWRVSRSTSDSGATLWDFGVAALGGLQAGVGLAEICLSGLGEVRLVPDLMGMPTGLAVQVITDAPYEACLRSQYAGWKLASGKFFAMGSGPMRAAAGVEPFINERGRESASTVIGVLETSKLPPDDIVARVAEACQVAPQEVTLLVARTASQAGNVQIVARSVETALHKLMELDFDVTRVLSGCGIAPLPPVAGNDLQGIGTTNDAILYGARVTLWVRGDDESLHEVVDKIPSCSSSDYGAPFGEIFARYQYDFYKIDPHLFSPALVCLHNLDTGRTFTAGRLAPEILARSWSQTS